MGEKQRKIGGGDRGTARGEAAGREALRDASSAELAKLAKMLGNDDVQRVMTEAAGKRDALLDLVMQRLHAVKELQMLEVHEIKNRKNWWRQVGQQNAGFGLPDAGRWRGPALAWRQVAQALAQGQLGRAASLIDRAVEAERVARAAMPKQIQVPTALRAPQKPTEVGDIGAGEGCPPASASSAFALADRVISQADRAEDVPVPRLFQPHQWWLTDAEQEEAKDAEKKGGKGAGRRRGKKTPEGTAAETTTQAVETKDKGAEKEKKTPEKGPEPVQERAPEHEHDRPLTTTGRPDVAEEPIPQPSVAAPALGPPETLKKPARRRGGPGAP